jgi:hypothetical protein
MKGCKNDVDDYILGTQRPGDRAAEPDHAEGRRASGSTTVPSPACTTSSTSSCSRASAGEHINNGVYMSYSTLLAIMGRMACYTGQEITWDMPR